MKNILLPFCVIALSASAQQTIHSVANGNASNPLTWDCTCFPTTDDHIFVDHQVVMNTDWLISSGGSIEIASGASLLQDASRQLLVDGAGSQFNNNGQTTFKDIAWTNGSTGINNGHMMVSDGLFFGTGTGFTNAGTIDGTDSVLTRGTFLNTGTFYVGNFLNMGMFQNSGQIAADSLGNTGGFSSNNGYVFANVFGNSGVFDLSTAGYMEVAADFYNAGSADIAAGRELFVGDDFYNGDTLGGMADFVNHGLIAVTGDFGNSDNLEGSGKICVGAYSANSGTVGGTLNFCDNSGAGGFDLNIGTIAGTVTYCGSGSCYLSIEETTSGETVSLYPNPAATILNIETDGSFETAAFYSVTGELVQTTVLTGKAIELNLPAGVYFVQLTGVQVSQPLRLVVE